jgi:ribosome-binding factor A
VSHNHREFSRVDRVAALVKKTLSVSLGKVVRDRNNILVTVTRVDVSPDLRVATAYLSVFGDSDAASRLFQEIIENIHSLQQGVAIELKSRRTPVLSFKRDYSVEEGDRISDLISRDGNIAREDKDE